MYDDYEIMQQVEMIQPVSATPNLSYEIVNGFFSNYFLLNLTEKNF